MKNAILGFGMFVLLSVSGLSHAATEWNAQEYDLYAGDFDGDGKTDILYIAKDPSMPSGIARSDGTGPNIAWQSWASNSFGINWSSNAYNIIVADFNGDGRADIFLQSVGPGDSFLLLTSNTGLVVGISQQISNGALGLTWSASAHHIVAADFNGDGKADLFLQATSSTGTNAVVLTDANGYLNGTPGGCGVASGNGPNQCWSDGYLGFKWSTQSANVFAGNFNGNLAGEAGLLIQAKPIFVMIDYDVPFPVPTYPPNMNGVVLSQGGSTPFTAVGAQAWSRMSNGVDWSPLTNNVVIATDGSGKSEVILQARNSTGTSYELTGNATGAIFPSTPTSLSSPSVSLSASSTHLIAANFAGGKVAGQVGLFFQALTSAGTNYTTTAVGTTIIASPENPTTVTGTVEPTSAGRTAGQFSVTPSGAAAYNIPIWTPPGAREIEPHLALHYTSGGPDGVMGPGWGLTGVSAIARCGKTWASTGGTATTVGSPTGVTLSTNDDLCLDGNRLRLIGGVQGRGGSTYMTEQAEFSLITANGSSSSPATYFTVQGKDGKYYEYGNTTDSKVTATGFSTPYVWGIDKISDRQSNSMAYAYIAGASTLTLSNIQYTATPGSATSGFKYQVSFTYATRSGGTTITRYVAGGAVTQSQQLSNIQVWSLLPSSTLVRKYNFGYSTSPTTSRPLLNSIQECGGTAGTDCLRPTSISYQPGLQGWNTSAVSTGVTATNGYVPVDLNGDGIPDALYSRLSGSSRLWYARIASRDSLGNISFGTEISTGITTGINDAVIPGRFTGVPGTQLLVPASGLWRVYTLVSGSSFSFASTGIPVNGEQFAIDYDGDGLSDLVNVGIGSVTIRRNMSGTLSGPYNATPAAISNPYNAAPAFASPTTVYVANSQNQGQIQNWTTSPWMAKSADFNGDGRGDLMLQESDLDTNTNGRVTNTIIVLSNGFGSGTTSLGTAVATSTLTGMTTNAVFVDWNGDGCTDIVSSHILFLSQCNGYFTNGNFTQPSATFSIPYPASGSPAPQVAFADWDGDGLPDLIYTDPSKSGNNVYVQRSTGAGVAPPVLLPLSVPSTKTLYALDQDADGQTDLAVVDSSSNFALSYYPHLGVGSPPDLATAFIDGFGIAFSPGYVTLETNIYTPGSGAQYPEMDFRGPMYVVNQFSASDGTGGTYQNTFTYSGIRLNLLGRGFEGFATTKSTDSRNGLVHSTAYSQSFPSIGSVLEDDIFQSGGTTPISKTSNSYYVAQLVGSSSGYSMPGSAGASAACPVSCFSYVKSTTNNRYELGAYKNGQLVSTAVTNYTYDPYGTLSLTNSTVTDNDSGSPISPFNGQSWVTQIQNYIQNDPANWCLGRPYTTTTQKTAPGQPALTRTVNHTIDSVNCRATNEVVEPNTPLQVTTTFQFDPSGCGNTTSVSVVGLDENGVAMPARTTKTDYNYFSGRCQFPEAVTNPITNPTPQTSYMRYQYNLGLKQTATDANGVSVGWTYDNFGRKTGESRPDLTSTTWSYVDCVSPSCWGTADLRFQATETLLNSTGSSVRVHETFSDGLDRIRYDEGNRVLGVWSTQVTTYDSRGRKFQVGLPYSSASNGYHIYTYDVGNRPLTDTLYTSTGAQYRQIQMAYQGQTATITDPNGFTNPTAHTITKVTDVAGKLRWVTDPPEGVHGAAAGTTKYTYDSFDNLVTIVDAIGATSSYTYNIRGFKIGSNDADTGSWTFQPDSLNELKVQTDANHAVTKFTYDLLGRMTTRLEPEFPSTPTSFNYGTNPTLHEIGQLNSVSKPDGYAESYQYDGIGRPLTKKYTEDGTTYQFDYAYNTLGAPDTLTYPISTSGVRFQLKYLYDSAGYLNEVKDASAGGAPFWTLTNANDNGAPTMEVLGNTVSVVTGYTPWTNEMISRTEGSGNSTTNLQNLNYAWDLNGNLLSRTDNRQSLTEAFTLDALNRLSTVTLINTATQSSVQTLSVQYDQAGDIINKSDVGAYIYGNASHPHAVTAAGTWTVGYDLNGNMNSRAGGAISSYSYNLPNQINYNGSSSQFNYDSSHQRWKQVANYAGTAETVHYIGGLLQVVTRGTNPTEYRHQIPAGSSTAIYTRRSDGTTGTYYATSDHLGSADLVMDTNANVLVRESFSPFGARRGSNWQSIPTTQDYTAIQSSTRQGFTGHEMLDSVGLIHMNGRVYDPTLGRFLSADTIVQSLGATQSINPYSYAWNEPLRYTDPSGHSIGGFIASLVTAIVTVAAYALLIYAGVPPFWALVGASFVGGFTGAYLATGSLSAALTSGLIAAAFAAIANPYVQAIAKVAVGCIQGRSSGNCGRVAEAELFSFFVSGPSGGGGSTGVWGTALSTVEAGVVGGIASKIAGGSFNNGFSNSAGTYLGTDIGGNIVDAVKQQGLAKTSSLTQSASSSSDDRINVVNQGIAAFRKDLAAQGLSPWISIHNDADTYWVQDDDTGGVLRTTSDDEATKFVDAARQRNDQIGIVAGSAWHLTGQIFLYADAASSTGDIYGWKPTGNFTEAVLWHELGHVASYLGGGGCIAEDCANKYAQSHFH